MRSRVGRVYLVGGLIAASAGVGIALIADPPERHAPPRATSPWREGAARILDLKEPEGAPPAPAAAADEEWRHHYAGPARITGRVLMADGSSAESAKVLCIPVGLRPLTSAQYEALTTACEEGGAFSLPALPDAPYYFFAAWKGRCFGHRTHWAAEVQGGGLTLEVREVAYERVGFFDAEGRPIDIAGRLLTPFSRCTVLASTHQYSESPAVLHVLGDMGIRLHAEAHEAIHVLSTEPHTRTSYGTCGSGSHAGPMTLEWPGYEKSTVDLARRPLGEWPAGDRVELRPAAKGAEAVVFRARLPHVEWPKSWGLEDPSLVARLLVEIDGSPQRMLLAPGIDTFHAPLDAPLRVTLPGHGTVGFERVRAGNAYELRPAYPELGYAEIRYPPGGDLGLQCQVSAVPTGRRAMEVQAISLWPGRARLGPVPAGEYEIFCATRPLSASTSRRILAHFGTVRVVPGLNIFEFEQR